MAFYWVDPDLNTVIKNNPNLAYDDIQDKVFIEANTLHDALLIAKRTYTTWEIDTVTEIKWTKVIK